MIILAMRTALVSFFHQFNRRSNLTLFWGLRRLLELFKKRSLPLLVSLSLQTPNKLQKHYTPNSLAQSAQMHLNSSKAIFYRFFHLQLRAEELGIVKIPQNSQKELECDWESEKLTSSE